MIQSDHSIVKQKKIGIFSGKGGVGKTSITASLAILLNNQGIPLLISDTDVDAPNLAILFRQKKLIEKHTFQTTEKAFHLPDRCNRCKMCVSQSFCLYNAIVWDTDKEIPKISNMKCEGCRACKLLCPMEAFDIKGIDSGTVHIYMTEFNMPIITGETILGSQSSGKLVTELKKVADQIATREHKTVILQDGPPGIGCPVIAATGGLDLAIVVLEPTNTALHDAARYIRIPKRFGIPIAAIIDKANINPEGTFEIKKLLSENFVELLGEIPLEENWPYSIASGMSIIQFAPECPASLELKKISEKLIKCLKT